MLEVRNHHKMQNLRFHMFTTLVGISIVNAYRLMNSVDKDYTRMGESRIWESMHYGAYRNGCRLINVFIQKIKASNIYMYVYLKIKFCIMLFRIIGRRYGSYYLPSTVQLNVKIIILQ